MVPGFSLCPSRLTTDYAQHLHRFVISWIWLITQNMNTVCRYFVSLLGQINKNTSWSSGFFTKEEDEGLFIYYYYFFFFEDGCFLFQIKQATYSSVWTHRKLILNLFVAWWPVLTLTLTGSDNTKKIAGGHSLIFFYETDGYTCSRASQ